MYKLAGICNNENLGGSEYVNAILDTLPTAKGMSPNKDQLGEVYMAYLANYMSPDADLPVKAITSDTEFLHRVDELIPAAWGSPVGMLLNTTGLIGMYDFKNLFDRALVESSNIHELYSAVQDIYATLIRGVSLGLVDEKIQSVGAIEFFVACDKVLAQYSELMEYRETDETLMNTYHASVTDMAKQLVEMYL